MEGFMPMSFAFSEANARAVGQYVQQGLLPALTSIGNQLTLIAQGIDLLTRMVQSVVLPVEILSEFGTIKYTTLRVYESNPNFLEDINITRRAIALLGFSYIGEVIDLLGAILKHLGQFRDLVQQGLAALNIEIQLGFTAVFALKDAVEQGLIDLNKELQLGFSSLFSILSQILARLDKGLVLSTQITFAIDLGGLSSFLAGLDIGKLAKLLAVATGFVVLFAAALAAVVGFVYLLAKALGEFTGTSLLAAVVVAGFVAVMVWLFTTIAGFDFKTLGQIAFGLALIVTFVYSLAKSLAGYNWDAIARIAVGLGAIVLFVALLGLALRLFNADVLNAIPALGKLFDVLINLAKAIAGFTPAQLQTIGLGFLGIVAFIALLGLALKLFNADVLNAIPALGQLFDALINLAKAIVGFTSAQLQTISLGFLGIAAFVGLLGLALKLFNVDVLNAIPALGQLFDALINLAQAIVSFTPDQLMVIGLGLLGIVGFVALLALALNSLDATAVAALPGLALLFDSIINLANAIVSFTPGQLLTIGLAFGVITLFVWGLAAALDFAAVPLMSLAIILTSLERIMNSVSGSGTGLLGVLGKLAGGVLSSVFGDLSSVSSAIGGAGQTQPATTVGIGAALPPTAASVATPAGLGFGGGPELSGGGGGLFPPAPSLAGPSLAGLPGPQAVDQSVNVQGGITVNINADRLEANSAQILSDEIVRALQERLGALRSEQDFRTGVRSSAPL